LAREFPVAGGLISFGASVPDAFRQTGIDGLAIFSFTLAEQPHLHKEFDHMPIVGDAGDADAGTQSVSVMALSNARWGALEHCRKIVMCHGLASAPCFGPSRRST
jgi:hypothetical protein